MFIYLFIDIMVCSNHRVLCFEFLFWYFCSVFCLFVPVFFSFFFFFFFFPHFVCSLFYIIVDIQTQESSVQLPPPPPAQLNLMTNEARESSTPYEAFQDFNFLKIVNS